MDLSMTTGMSVHSLEGALAISYVSEHLESLDDLTLLVAYPTKNFKLKVFFRSEDGVLDMDKVEVFRGGKLKYLKLAKKQIENCICCTKK